MNLTEFKALWESEDIRLNLVKEQTVKGYNYQLYYMIIPFRSREYGRHGAIILKLDLQGEVVGNMTYNIQGQGDMVYESHLRLIENWFEEVVSNA